MNDYLHDILYIIPTFLNQINQDPSHEYEWAVFSAPSHSKGVGWGGGLLY